MTLEQIGVLVGVVAQVAMLFWWGGKVTTLLEKQGDTLTEHSGQLYEHGKTLLEHEGRIGGLEGKAGLWGGEERRQHRR